MPKKIDENALKNFADAAETPKNVAEATTYDLPIANEPSTPMTPEERLRAQAPVRKSLEEAQEEKKTEILHEIHSNGLGYLPVKVEDLPTKGIFYPEGTQLFIRAATGSEIRHWSQTNETELTDVDDSLNYILERCLSVRFPGRLADYKDITEIDRLYLILSIRDFTFTAGNNELMIKISENKQIPLKKENIDFIKFEDKIMRFYNAEKRCFTIQQFTTKKGQEINLSRPLNIYFPRIGITKWLKEYVIRMRDYQEGFDRDFISMAPLLIPDYRGLNDEKYASIIQSCDYFGVYEYSILEQFKRVISQSINPKFVYQDEEGVEQHAPLNFQGGIKALFLFGGMDDLI